MRELRFHEPGRDDFHVVPFLNPEDWDDVELVPTTFIDGSALQTCAI
jgi:hypothetical protein